MRTRIIAGLAILLFAMASGGRADDSLPADYWRQPLAPQGKAPAHWSEAERAIAPEACGACHPDKLEEWRTSLHAQAFSPGLVGQLLSVTPDEARACLNCHAPLAEQAAAFEAARRRGKSPLGAGWGLAAAGNSCGGCHLRGHRRFGPPQRGTGTVGPGDPNAPHGGGVRTIGFERSEFCGPCHQFPQEQAVNGKPLENTVEEWRQSPQAAAGQTCQSCHMPERRHLWRGIHDPAMTAGGLTPEVTTDRDRLRFSVSNSGVGHAFPTYVTPRAVLHVLLLDAGDQPVPGSERTHVIQRQVEYDGTDWREIADTRLLPGQTAGVEIAWKDARRARVWLEVLPDHFYHAKTYPPLLRELAPHSAAARLITQANAGAARSGYRLFMQEVNRP